MSRYDEAKLITAMVGREITALYPQRHHEASGPILRVRGLQRTAGGPVIDFHVDAGEILGIGGLLGSGRSELLLSIFGAEPIAAGEIEIEGRPVHRAGPRSMMNAGLGLLTEDRKVLGLLPELSIRENVTIASLRRDSRHGLVPGRGQAEEAEKRARAAESQAREDEKQVRGDLDQEKVNQQNDQRERGARQVNAALVELADLEVVSSYLPELLGLADRVLVLRDGAIAGQLGPGASEEDVLTLASGRGEATGGKAAGDA